MKRILVLVASVCIASAGCSDTPKAPILPTTPLTEQQVIQIRSEDDKVAFEESQGSIKPAASSAPVTVSVQSISGGD